jgi:hypothetical protein
MYVEKEVRTLSRTVADLAAGDIILAIGLEPDTRTLTQPVTVETVQPSQNGTHITLTLVGTERGAPFTLPYPPTQTVLVETA